MNFLYTDLPMTHVLRLDPYSNPAISRAFLPKDVNNNSDQLAEAAVQATEAVLTYRAPQKYEEPELSNVTGGLHHSQWTADLVLSKSSMARAELEVGTEAGEDLDWTEVQDATDEPISITVVREHVKRQPVVDDKAILTDQYLSVWRRKSLAGYKVSDMHYSRRE